MNNKDTTTHVYTLEISYHGKISHLFYYYFFFDNVHICVDPKTLKRTIVSQWRKHSSYPFVCNAKAAALPLN